jgi:hypothetical protein
MPGADNSGLSLALPSLLTHLWGSLAKNFWKDVPHFVQITKSFYFTK